MSVTIDPRTGTESELSQARIDAILDSGRNIFREEGAKGAGKIRLWDKVDQSWSRELPHDLAIQHYLLKVVDKCSACTYVSVFGNGDSSIVAHVRKVQESYHQHKSATIEIHRNEREIVQICTGCGTPFSSRRNGGQKHLNATLEAGPAHKEATKVTMLRFSLTPDGPVSAPVATVVKEQDSGSQPEVGVERLPERRRRRRHRGRRSSHGNAGN
jgi:hypothetical protein